MTTSLKNIDIGTLHQALTNGADLETVKKLVRQKIEFLINPQKPSDENPQNIDKELNIEKKSKKKKLKRHRPSAPSESEEEIEAPWLRKIQKIENSIEPVNQFGQNDGDTNDATKNRPSSAPPTDPNRARAMCTEEETAHQKDGDEKCRPDSLVPPEISQDFKNENRVYTGLCREIEFVENAKNYFNSELLMEFKAWMTAKDKTSRNCLHISSYRSSVGVVRSFLNTGYDTTGEDGKKLRVRFFRVTEGAQRSMLPLHFAVAGNKVENVIEILRHKASPNSRVTGNLMTAAHMAAKKGSVDILRVLLQAGAYPDLETSDKHSVLTIADNANRDAVRDCILKYTVRIKDKDNDEDKDNDDDNDNGVQEDELGNEGELSSESGECDLDGQTGEEDIKTKS